jgi:CheY-like chemotaxis protein
MILLNLVVNARDAMPRGGEIVVATRDEILREQDGTRLKPGSYICLTVSDNGEGMDEVTLRRATEPFFTTKGTGKGTGLGLAMVSGVAEQSGGWFGLRSRKGEGTIAELWLPVAEEHRPAVDRPEPAVNEAQAHHLPLVVVVVDDDSLVLTNTVAMLEDLGHTVVAASSGKEALHLIRQQGAVDLVITDYAMPHMTGLQLAEGIEKEWPGLPVILATGFAEMEAMAARTWPRLKKPFAQPELAHALARTLQVSRTSGHV